MPEDELGDPMPRLRRHKDAVGTATRTGPKRRSIPPDICWTIRGEPDGAIWQAGAGFATTFRGGVLSKGGLWFRLPSPCGCRQPSGDSRQVSRTIARDFPAALLVLPGPSPEGPGG